MKNSLLVASIIMAIFVSGSVARDDWPNWRGGQHDGISRETLWRANGVEKPVWKASVGLGYSCVAISDGRLFTLGFDEQSSVDVVYCLDKETGKKLWTQEFPARRWNKFHAGGTNSTPVVHAGRVYTFNRDGMFHCFEAKTGNILWSKDVKRQYELRLPTWGFASSPLVINDRVFLNADRVLAFHSKTGDLVWKSKPGGAGYSTPVFFDKLGDPALAVMNAGGLFVLRVSDGSKLTTLEWNTKEDVNAATPVIVEGCLFISSGYDRGAALIGFDEGKSQVVWENKGMRNKMATSVLWNKHLYGFDESVLKCMDLKGNEKWRKPRLGPGALTASDGKLIVMTSKGDLTIVKATPDRFQELSRTHLFNNGQNWTMPVLSDGLIYCRNSNGELVCQNHRLSSVGEKQESGLATKSLKRKSLLPINHGVPDEAIENYWKKGSPPPDSGEFMRIANKVGVAEAVAVFRAVRKEHQDYLPFDFKQWRDVGWYQLSQGKKRDAVLASQLLVDAFPKKADSYRRLADAMVAIGEDDQAVKFLEHCLQLDPDHRHAQSLLKQLKD